MNILHSIGYALLTFTCSCVVLPIIFIKLSVNSHNHNQKELESIIFPLSVMFTLSVFLITL